MSIFIIRIYQRQINDVFLFIPGASGPNHRIECPIFSQLPIPDRPAFLSPENDSDPFPPCPAYSAVIPLRILALKKSNPELWARVDLLMDHVEDMGEEEKTMWEVRHDQKKLPAFLKVFEEILQK